MRECNLTFSLPSVKVHSADTGCLSRGASMSGDLKHPSRAIPKGTLYGIALTFGTYTVVILALAATVTRESFYHNANVIQDVSPITAKSDFPN